MVEQSCLDKKCACILMILGFVLHDRSAKLQATFAWPRHIGLAWRFRERDFHRKGNTLRLFPVRHTRLSGLGAKIYQLFPRSSSSQSTTMLRRIATSSCSHWSFATTIGAAGECRTWKPDLMLGKPLFNLELNLDTTSEFSKLDTDRRL
jgi:hypothetical protein